MPLVMKLDDETKTPIVTEDNKIIYYDDQDPDEKDLPLDPVGMYNKIGELGKQNKKDRDNYRELRDKIAPFEGIENLSEWKEKAEQALATVENFNDKDFMKADKVEKLKLDMAKAYDQKLADKDKVFVETLQKHNEVVGTKDSVIRSLMVSNQFAQSSFFTGERRKTILPPDIGESYFGKHFKVEEKDGKAVLRAYDKNDDLITSRLNPGEPAEFEEAMGIIIDQYPNRDNILAASGGGSGGQGGQGNNGDPDNLASLKKQHKEALSQGKTQLAISLKNKIFAIEQSL